jgi:cell fate (sporulation/competence/biofilm development) regulator YlbF (YheA/YmcA/DUF963 family)
MWGDEMKEILDLAEKLGAMIAESERYMALKECEESVETDKEAKALFDDYLEHNNRLAGLEASASPIEPEDKKKLAAAREKLLACAKAQELMRRQADFAELMNRVNGRIGAALRGSGGDEG